MAHKDENRKPAAVCKSSPSPEASAPGLHRDSACHLCPGHVLHQASVQGTGVAARMSCELREGACREPVTARQLLALAL